MAAGDVPGHVPLGRHLEALGLSSKNPLTLKALRAAYHVKAKRHHPDRAGPQSHEAFVKLQVAYEAALSFCKGSDSRAATTTSVSSSTRQTEPSAREKEAPEADTNAPPPGIQAWEWRRARQVWDDETKPSSPSKRCVPPSPLRPPPFAPPPAPCGPRPWTASTESGVDNGHGVGSPPYQHASDPSRPQAAYCSLVEDVEMHAVERMFDVASRPKGTHGGLVEDVEMRAVERMFDRERQERQNKQQMHAASRAYFRRQFGAPRASATQQLAATR